MYDTDQVFNLIESVNCFSKAAEKTYAVNCLDNLIKRSFRKIDVKMFSYRRVSLDVSEGVMAYELNQNICNYGIPDSWWSLYHNHQFKRDDPFIYYVLKNNKAIQWSEFANSQNVDFRTLQYIDAVNSLDVELIFALPVHRIQGRSGAFILGFKSNLFSLSKTEISLLQLACQIAHYRYGDLLQME